MRIRIVAGNWKMNTTPEEGRRLAAETIECLDDRVPDNTLVILCPPYTHLEAVAGIIQKKGRSYFTAGAQNCHQEGKGAYTGEVSAAMIRAAGAGYVILGHSERRQCFGELNELLSKKIDAALSAGLKVIYCCGESLEQRDKGQHFIVIGEQLEKGLFHLNGEQIRHAVIAYEPVWAIGTGRNATPEQAQEAHGFIRGLVEKNYGRKPADELSILYGGSCNPKNAASLFSRPDIDGGLIGGASLKAEDFAAVVKGLP